MFFVPNFTVSLSKLNRIQILSKIDTEKSTLQTYISVKNKLRS